MFCCGVIWALCWKWLACNNQMGYTPHPPSQQRNWLKAPNGKCSSSLEGLIHVDAKCRSDWQDGLFDCNWLFEKRDTSLLSLYALSCSWVLWNRCQNKETGEMAMGQWISDRCTLSAVVSGWKDDVYLKEWVSGVLLQLLLTDCIDPAPPRGKTALGNEERH